MEQRPAAHGGHHEPFPAPPVSARSRLAAAVRDDRAGARPGTPAGDTSPRLPPEDGLEPVRRLGGRSWLVRESRSGEHFVLRPCPEGPGPGQDRSRTALRTLAVALAGREEPCLVAVRGLLGPAAAPVGLVEDFLPGGSLADRLSEHGRLAPGEAASVLRDAATGLASLHALGRCHGELSARQVLFRGHEVPAPPGGAPGPEGAGPAAALRAGAAAGTREEDVHALGVLGWAALTGRAPAGEARRVPLSLLCPGAPPGLVSAVEDALHADPSDRPAAAELAARFAESGAPAAEAPSILTGRPVRVRAGGGHRSLLLGAALLLAAGGAVLLVPDGAGPPPGPAAAPPAADRPAADSSTARPSTTHPAPAPRPPGRSVPAAGPGGGAPHVPADGGADSDTDADSGSDTVDPRRALAELVARRGEALRTGDVRLLDEVYAPGAEAAAADRDTIARSGGGFPGLSFELGNVRAAPAQTPEPEGVVLLAEVRVDGFRGGPGTVPAVVPDGDGWVQTVLVVMVDEEDGWRFAAVAPAASATARPGAHADEQE
ncbi:hypothetical protein [Kocuria sp. NPDC057446]|uniref:hypothetical protein n=1 Tax=Kocuria sp. NPDC057446 TaxID=3346137 RepID=UPI0036CF754F